MSFEEKSDLKKHAHADEDDGDGNDDGDATRMMKKGRLDADCCSDAMDGGSGG